MTCGIYRIRCVRNGYDYIGSSKRIATRWAQHRRDLRRGTSVCVYLQNAWTKHGEAAFHFSILEECTENELEAREQWHIDRCKPRFNSIIEVKRRYSPEARAKIAAKARARAAAITHCPRGHEYDDKNTYRGRGTTRICRTCNAERVAKIIGTETPEERAKRNASNNARYYENHEANRAKQKEYVAKTKEQKREYDRLHRAEATKRKRERLRNQSPEEHAIHLAKKRASYHRNKGKK